MTAAAAAVSKQLGRGRETVRRWVVQADVDADRHDRGRRRPAPTPQRPPGRPPARVVAESRQWGHRRQSIRSARSSSPRHASRADRQRFRRCGPDGSPRSDAAGLSAEKFPCAAFPEVGHTVPQAAVVAPVCGRVPRRRRAARPWGSRSGTSRTTLSSATWTGRSTFRDHGTLGTPNPPLGLSCRW